MQFISSKLKRFDVHRKTADTVKDQTVVGAIITVLSFVIIALLLYSNMVEYFKAEESTRMVLDKSVGIEDVKIIFNVSFYFVQCKGKHSFVCLYLFTLLTSFEILYALHVLDISFKQEVIRGTLHHHEPEIFHKEDFNSVFSNDGMPGCTASGSLITDKVGGNFMLITSVKEGSPNVGVPGLEQMMLRGFGIPGMLMNPRIPQDLG